MFGSKFILCPVLALFFAVTTCQVIVREVNKREGSVCFLANGSRGVCRRDCGEQAANNQNEYVCNPGQDQPLYCCNYNTDAQYPTLHEVCQDRRLATEFVERGLEESRELIKIHHNLREDYKKHIANVEKWCNDTALAKDEEERGFFLSECSNVPQQLEASLTLNHPERMYYLPEVTVLGYNSSFRWVCPGVLVHPSFILASAQCLMETRKKDSVFELKPYLILGGQTAEEPIQSSDYYSYGSTYKVHRVFTHPDNNIALLEVKIDIEYEEETLFRRPLPACLWTERIVPQNFVSAVGFWDTSDEKKNGGIFAKGNVSLVQSADCKNHDNISHICTHTEFHGKDTCGDASGGYLQIIEDNWLQIPYLAGIASLHSTCTANEVTEYISIYPYLGWIENIIRVK